MKVESFKVVHLAAGPWALVEHPLDLDDIQAWNAQRRAMAILAGPHAAAIKTNPADQQRWKELRNAADAEIATAQTWVNLNQAIAIAPLPVEEGSGKLTIKSISISPK